MKVLRRRAGRESVGECFGFFGHCQAVRGEGAGHVLGILDRNVKCRRVKPTEIKTEGRNKELLLKPHWGPYVRSECLF